MRIAIVILHRHTHTHTHFFLSFSLSPTILCKNVLILIKLIIAFKLHYLQVGLWQKRTMNGYHAEIDCITDETMNLPLFGRGWMQFCFYQKELHYVRYYHIIIIVFLSMERQMCSMFTSKKWWWTWWIAFSTQSPACFPVLLSLEE